MRLSVAVGPPGYEEQIHAAARGNVRQLAYASLSIDPQHSSSESFKNVPSTGMRKDQK
jgi:hypothetical protein